MMSAHYIYKKSSVLSSFHVANFIFTFCLSQFHIRLEDIWYMIRRHLCPILPREVALVKYLRASRSYYNLLVLWCHSITFVLCESLSKSKSSASGTSIYCPHYNVRFSFAHLCELCCHHLKDYFHWLYLVIHVFMFLTTSLMICRDVKECWR